MTSDFGKPQQVSNDPRIGKHATTTDGFTGVVESILRYPDGFEHIQIKDEGTGKARGGLTPDQVKIRTN